MGRPERFLLALLIVCGAGVGWLALSSHRKESPGGDHSSAASARRRAGERVAAGAISPTTRPAGASDMGAATLANPAHPAPERDIPALRRRISSGSRDTYMDAMLLHNDSMIVRWPDRYGQPVRAWIQPLPNVHGWSGNMVARARQSFAAWSSIQLPIRFEFVTDSATAEIVLVWRDQLDGARVGITRRYRDMSGWLGRAEIAIAMRTADGAAVDDKYVDGVMSHEVGHALGLDHSPERSDLMAERNEGVFEPSIRDRNTLALIYSIPPGSIR